MQSDYFTIADPGISINVCNSFSQAGTQNHLKDHFSELQNNVAEKNGYVYIYVSNTSAINVFFDNLQVVHTRGPILEETHYYPFGLTMSGISSKALNFGVSENRFKFNDGTEFGNKEFSDGSGLDIYETPFRGYDPQIGRFLQIDAMADDFVDWSPYNFALNNPISFNDPTGLQPDCDDCPTGKLAEVKQLDEVVLNPVKNKWGYSRWAAEADRMKGGNYNDIYNKLKSEGVNERGLTLFSKAWGAIGYRERKAKLDEEAWNFERKIAIEFGVWLSGEGLLFYGGKVVNWGYRGYSVYKKARAAKGGGQLLLKPGAANLTQQGLEHIVARHWFSSGAKGAGKFLEGTTARGLKDMIGTATTNGVFRANTMGRAGTIAEYNFGRVIGTTSGGAPASSLRVVIGTNGNVITAFPF